MSRIPKSADMEIFSIRYIGNVSRIFFLESDSGQYLEKKKDRHVCQQINSIFKN